MSGRSVALRAERDGDDRRFLDASLQDGDLVLAGQDLGPATAVVSANSVYEWFRTVPHEHLPGLVAALGGVPGEDVLDLLARVATGPGSYELEALLRDGVVPSQVHVV